MLIDPPKKNEAVGITRIRCLALALGLTGMLILAGCGTREIRPTGNEDDVHDFLSAALDAWQSGQTPDELREESPPVYVSDFEWAAGKTLKAYQAPEAPEEHGGEWRVSVLLTLSGPGESEVQKAVAYSVTTERSAVVITRAEEHE
jgi:hypothetical protein